MQPAVLLQDVMVQPVLCVSWMLNTCKTLLTSSICEEERLTNISQIEKREMSVVSNDEEYVILDIPEVEQRWQ